MDYKFQLQDPTDPDTVYLLEAIIDAAREASSWNGVFAFASRNGVDALMADPEMQHFLSRAPMSLIVGIDAVTDRGTLERLIELEQEYAHLSVRVFWNRTAGLFHPKIARFVYPDGRRTLIVGSGNLTPGGLRQNFEAYNVLRASAREPLDLTSWEQFLDRHTGDIRAIDDAALERAAQNVVRGVRRRREDVEPEPGAPPVVVPVAPIPEEVAVPVGGSDRILIAQVPAAGGRWHQVHFNREVVGRFFQVRPDSTQRVYLVEARQDGTFGEQEVRPCVYSQENKNLKIELASHRGATYPANGRPVAVFRELQARSFAYMLLMPGEPGHTRLFRLTEQLPSIGKGVRRTITDVPTVAAAWPACPLVTAIAAPGA